VEIRTKASTRIFPIYKKEESQFAAVLLGFAAVAETESGGRETE
jgi:hypothetical protein